MIGISTARCQMAMEYQNNISDFSPVRSTVNSGSSECSARCLLNFRIKLATNLNATKCGIGTQGLHK